MKSRWLPIGLSLLAGAALLATHRTAGVDWLGARLHAQQPGVRPPDDRAPRPPQGRPPDAGPRSAGERVIGPLNHAYDQITFATVWMSSSQAKLSREDAGLLDQSKELYRKALTAYRAGQYRRAEGTALAAHDAARGVMHVLQATMPAVEGLPVPPLEAGAGAPPPPPPGQPRPDPRDREPSAAPPRDRLAPPPPRDREAPPPGVRERPMPDREGVRRDGSAMVRDAIREIRDELPDAAPGSPRGAGQPFVSAARRALDQAQRAADAGKNRQAIQFVMAAEAWSHVPEHLKRAGRNDARSTTGEPGLREPPSRERGPATPPSPVERNR